MKIRLVDKVECYSPIDEKSYFEIGEIFEEDEPYMGLNPDGSFTICQGMGIYINVRKEQFEIIEEEKKENGENGFNYFFHPVKI